jgi:putative ABC transport system permease protein
MISHLFKLVWNRKRSTLLVMVELFFCYLVICALFTAATSLVDHYNNPLGFSHERVWRLSFERPSGTESDEQKSREILHRLLHTLQASPNIEEAAAINVSPFSFSTWNTSFEVNSRMVSTNTNIATEELQEVLHMPLTSGRWFRPGDEALNWTPMIINEKLGREIFGNTNPVGQVFPKMNENEKERRVIGVIPDFRQDGRLTDVFNYFFEYANLRHTTVSSGDTLGGTEIARTQPAMPENILLRVAPGTPLEFEERVLALAEAEAPDWKFRIKSLDDMHTLLQNMRLTPIIASGTVAVFFLLMVALGLVGVIWQNVTRRTGEFGLRRAVGATAREIYRQILGELLALTTFSILAGLLIAVQFPLLSLLGDVPARVYITGFVLSIVFMYGTVLVCGLYPAVLATRIQPTEALHYE